MIQIYQGAVVSVQNRYTGTCESWKRVFGCVGIRICAPHDLAMGEQVNDLPGLDEEAITQIGVARKGIPAGHQIIIYRE